MFIYLKKQIKIQTKTHVRTLIFDKILTIILAKYFNYSNIFLVNNIVKFLKYTIIIYYTIKLEKNKQSFFSLIYYLKLVKLEILKTYIEINLTNNFIQSSKSLVKVFIFID